MSIQLEKDVELPRQRRRISVRAARRSDFPAIRRVVCDSYRPYVHLMPSRAHRRFIADLIDFEHHSRHGHVMVAETDGQIHGSIVLYPAVSTPGFDLPVGWASARALAVSHGTGDLEVAESLILEGERRAWAEGASAFTIRVAPFMTEATRRYQAIGYQRVSRYDINLGHIYGFARWNPTRLLALSKSL